MRKRKPRELHSFGRLGGLLRSENISSPGQACTAFHVSLQVFHSAGACVIRARLRAASALGAIFLCPLCVRIVAGSWRRAGFF